MDFDVQGKLNRRIWLQEQRIEELTRKVDALTERHEEELRVELAIAAGLRDRIGKLEERLRLAKQETVEAIKCSNEMARKSDSLFSRYQMDEARLTVEAKDLREALGKLRQEKAEMEARLDQKTNEQRILSEELNDFIASKGSISKR